MTGKCPRCGLPVGRDPVESDPIPVGLCVRWKCLLREVIDLRADNERLRERALAAEDSQRWVPVSERLPMDLLCRIVVDEHGYVFPSRAVLPYGSGKWLDFDGASVTTKIVAWRLMPAPPKGEK